MWEKKTVKHFLCWKKFQFSGLGSNHPIPTLIEVLTQTANNQNAFSKNMLSAYISHIWYTYFCIMHVLSLFKWYHDNRISFSPRTGCSVIQKKRSKCTLLKLGQSPDNHRHRSILFLSYLKNIKQMQQVRLFISHLQIIWRLT